MSSDAMRVRLHLCHVRVLEVVADSPGRLEVAVGSGVVVVAVPALRLQVPQGA